MKVLIAVDGSANSFAAIGQIAQLLKGGKDEIALYCAPPAIHLTAGATSQEVLVRARQALADAIFDEARKHLPTELQTGVHTILGTQDPRHGIVVAVEQWPANLLVVGARGLGKLERLLLGSVSRAVVHAARFPVWVARSQGAEARQGFRVLLACESPELGRRGAEVLNRLTWPRGTTGHTLTVVPSMFAGHVPEWLQQRARSPDVEAMVQAWTREHDDEKRRNLARMQDFAQSLPAPFLNAPPIVTEGEPATEILAAIAREKIDLVVVGTRRKHAVASAILGSTSEAVLNHAGCSVLVVPHQEAP
jgi:nucleotide-binding universal stress UspA family protein